VTGGWASANEQVFLTQLLVPFAEFSDQRRVNGFVGGGGAEYGVTPWLSLKGEILYVNLERRSFTPVPSGCQPDCDATVKSDFVLARMGLNWRFGGVGKGKGKAPVAVVAKY
jgi:opacity protein-like surface antigen